MIKAEVTVMPLLKQGHEPRKVGGCEKLEKARNMLSSRASGRNATLPPPEFLPSETHVTLLTFRTVRQ